MLSKALQAIQSATKATRFGEKPPLCQQFGQPNEINWSETWESERDVKTTENF